MRKTALAFMALWFTHAALAASVGQAAPGFTATDSHGAQHSLAEYKGKFVILEWTNQGCPFTRKHYETGNMEKLQKYWTSKGVVCSGRARLRHGPAGERLYKEDECRPDGCTPGS